MTAYAEVIPVNPTAPLLPACRRFGTYGVVAHIDILLEAIYSPLECLPKNKKSALNCYKVPWTC